MNDVPQEKPTSPRSLLNPPTFSVGDKFILNGWLFELVRINSSSLVLSPLPMGPERVSPRRLMDRFKR